MKAKYQAFILGAVALAAASVAQAALTADEVKQLGTTLAPFGGEMAGNKDGSIPAYTGGNKTPPAGFDVKSGKWPDPFPNDKPLFSISASNMDKYAGKLTPGTEALLKRFNTFRVDVYQTRRTYWQEKKYLDRAIKNASNAECKVVSDGEGVQGCWGGVAFPIPKSAYEVMWNSRLKQLAPSKSITENWLVAGGKEPIFILRNQVSSEYPYWDLNAKPYEGNARYNRRYVSYAIEPARNAGNITLTWDPMDFAKDENRTWSYSAGQRRVRLAPENKYDTPIAVLGAALYFDEPGMFTGRMDRYDFKLAGKKEMFVPYNGYRQINVASPKDALGPNHLNPEVQRWELHRVWVVEATVKAGMRHAMTKRTFYIDEDSWALLASEGYDASGKIARVLYAGGVSDYLNGGSNDMSSALQAYDMTKAQYLVMGFNAGKSTGHYVDQPPIPAVDLTPDGMAAKGVR